MPMYRIPVIAHATAYIRADNAREAENIARRALPDACIEVSGGGDDVEISGEEYSVSPDVSLSPAMTLELPSDAEAELAEDDEENDDD